MSKDIRFTQKEQGSILNLLGSVAIKGTDDNALEMVNLIQSIKGKVIALTEEPKPEPEKARTAAK